MVQPTQTSGTVLKEGPDVVAEPFAAAPLLKHSWWGGIFAGSFVASALQALSYTLGGAIAFAVYKGGTGQMEELGGGAIAWILVTAFVTLFAGGWIAAQLSGAPNRLYGALHGLTTWAVVTVFSLIVAGGTLGGMRQAQEGAGGPTASAPTAEWSSRSAPRAGWRGQIFDRQQQGWQGQAGWNQGGQGGGFEQQQQGNYPAGGGTSLSELDLPSGVESDLERMLRGQEVDPQLADALRGVFSGAPVVSEDRQQLVTALAPRANLSHEQAERVVDRWIVNYERSQGIATSPGHKGGLTAKKASAFATVGFTSFFALLVGGIGAAVGGLIPRPAHQRRLFGKWWREERT